MNSNEEEISVIATEEEESPNGIKIKRRSKRDQQGRTFKCGCEKMYLSYPALYTHIKTKHDGVSPPGTETPQTITNRGRGRPRKGPLQPEEKVEIKQIPEENPLDELGILGGSTDALIGFDDPNSELLNKIKEWKDRPIEEIKEKEKLNCEDIFAIYLIEIASTVTNEPYKNFILYFENLKTCLNLRGYQLHKDEPKFENYCKVKNAQKVPEIFNYYIQQYMPLYFPSFNKDVAIRISLHFAKWLLTHDFTNTRLMMYDEAK